MERLSSSYTQTSITDWLYKTPMVSLFLRIVVRLGLSIMRERTEHMVDLGSLVPKCNEGKLTSFCSLLDFPSVMFLNSHIPFELQKHWRLLFSTQIHGESFSKLCGQLVDQGPSLLVLRDSDGSIFGGFASQSWEAKPQFKGEVLGYQNGATVGNQCHNRAVTGDKCHKKKKPGLRTSTLTNAA